VVEVPFLGETNLAISRDGILENIAEGTTRASGSNKGGIDSGYSLGFVAQIVGKPAKMHQAGQGAYQAVTPSTQDEHSIAIKPLTSGKRMAEGEDALVCGDQVDDNLHPTSLGFRGEQGGDLILALPGSNGADGGIHGSGALLAELAEALTLLGG
jgi:hypothetical protein